MKSKPRELLRIQTIVSRVRGELDPAQHTGQTVRELLIFFEEPNRTYRLMFFCTVLLGVIMRKTTRTPAPSYARLRESRIFVSVADRWSPGQGMTENIVLCFIYPLMDGNMENSP